MYPKLWEASGMSQEQLVERLIGLGFERHEREKGLKRNY
jgi:D-alanine-D-alanine ligase